MVLVDISAISQLFIDFVNFAIVVRINWNNVYKTFSLRTKTGYENNIAALWTNPSYSSLYGIKENSSLNELSYYHVTSAHDLFEGFAVNIVTSVVIHCIKSGYLTLENFNITQTFSYTDADKSNKPQPVEIKALNQFRVK